MEDKSSRAEKWLDAFNEGKVNYNEFAKEMEEAGIHNIEEAISLHHSAVNIVQRYNVLQQVADVHKRYTDMLMNEKARKQKVLVVKMKPFLRVAAVLLLVLTSFAVFFIATTTQGRLVASLSQEYHIQVNRTQTDKEIWPIVAAFNNNNFPVVVYEYEKLANPSSREMFLGGYAYLQTQRPEKAIAIFSTILTQNKLTGKRLYQDEAEYYLLLTLIHDKRYEEAYPIAENIHTDNYHTYHTKITSWLLLKLKWLSWS